MKNQSAKSWNHWSYQLEGEGPCLVLLHGFPQSGALWDELRERLNSSYRLMIVDLPGAGQSAYQSGLTMDSMGADLGEILHNEGIDAYWIAGHSMGGYVALAHASSHARGLVGLSLIHSSAAADTEEKREQRRKSIRLLLQGGKKPFIQQMIPALFAEEVANRDSDLMESFIHRSMEISTEALIAFYEAMIDRRDHRDWLSKTDLPIQFVMGSEDKIAPTEAIWPQTTLANRTFVKVLEGCGHMSMVEDPRGLASALHEFGDYIFGR